MKKVIHSSFQKLNRMICSMGFWIAIILIVIITLTCESYTDVDGAKYSMLTILFNYDMEARIQNHMDMQSLLLLIQGTLSMYGMLFAALSYASVLCEEQKNGVRRYVLLKEGKWNYVLSNAFATILSSGLVFLVGTAIVIGFICWNYPVLSELDKTAYEYWFSYQSENAPWFYSTFGEMACCIQLLFGVFLYGTFCGFVGFLCAAFFSNVYLLTCIPFFVGYFYFSIMQVIYARVFEGVLPIELMQVLNTYVSPECYIKCWNYKKSLPINIAILLVIWILVIGVHRACLEKRADCGGV